MRKVLSIGGRCEQCGWHVGLKVTSTIGTYTHYIFGVVGFFIGGLVGWLI